MFRFLVIILIFYSLFVPFALADESSIEISSEAAILMEFNNGQILYEKNAFKRLAPASTTKVLTALLALDYGEAAQQVKITAKAARVGEASIYLQQGEILTIEELLKGALIKSGNDAAYALAETVAGNAELFANLMDRKAMSLGAFDSHFVNPNGLPHKEHLTNAHDLAVITREAVKDPLFNDIVSTKYASIPWGNHSWKRSLKNTNRLLFSYPGADGIKTGTTRQAGSCLIASATRGDRRLIAVVLNSGNRYGDIEKLLNFGFDNFTLKRISSQSIVGKVRIEREVLPLAAAEKMMWSLPKDRKEELEYNLKLHKKLYPPLEKGETVGIFSVLLNGKELTCVRVITAKELKKPPLLLSRYFKFSNE